MDDRKTYNSQRIPARNDTPPQQIRERNDTTPMRDEKESGRRYVQMLYNELCRFADVIVENAASERLGVHSSSKQKKSAPKPQKIPPPSNDAARIYNDMRKLERYYGYGGNIRDLIYGRSMNAQLFYAQAVFMREFSDNCGFTAPFEPLSPSLICYEHMSREQLRTYFSWRREIREGLIRRVPYAYALLYIYELLNLDCADNPRGGLDKILSFWRSFRLLDDKIDERLPALLMDYYIYYLPDTPLDAFLDECGIREHFNRHYKKDCNEELLKILYSASKYNVRESAFYKSEGGAELTDSCVLFVADYLEKRFRRENTGFFDCIYRLAKTSWRPFGETPFYSQTRIEDRTVDITPCDSYLCRNGKWFHKSVYYSDTGKTLAGYTIKCTESALRRVTRYKRKITANPDMLDYTITRKLTKFGISLEDEINDAVAKFLTEKNKVVVTVDTEALGRIRHEAREIQEKLTVEDSVEDVLCDAIIAPKQDGTQNVTPAKSADIWRNFAESLTETESGALRSILAGGDFRRTADEAGVMAEVLADSINEKAYDAIGDSIMDFDGGAIIFDEYRDKLTEVLS